MPITRVQGNAFPSSGASSGTSMAVTLGATVGSGNSVCGICTWGGNGGTNSGALTSVTDDQGNNYNLEAVLYQSTDDQYYCSFSRTNITNGPITITANLNVSDSFRAISADEFNGTSTASSDERDVHGGQYQASPGSGTDAITSGPFTTTVNGDLLWGGTGSPDNNLVSGTGFTTGTTSTAGPSLFTEYRVQTTAASGTAATFSMPGNNETATWLIAIKPAGAAAPANLDVPAAPPTVRRPSATRGAALRFDAGALFPVQPAQTLLPLIEVQSFQPPNPGTTNVSLNNRSAALAGGNVGNQFPQIGFLPFGWPVQSVQPPNPAIANISQNNRRVAALVGGIELGNEFPQIRFLPFGWPIQSVQPPNPLSGNLARNNTKFAALVGGIENIEGVFVFTPPVLSGWWETTVPQPPRPRWMRAAALEGGIEWGGEQFVVRWFNAGWAFQSVQPPARTKQLRMVVTYDGDDGIEAPFVPPVAVASSWGFDPTLPIARFQRMRIITLGDPGNENAFIPPVAGWGFDQTSPIARPLRMRTFMDGDQGNENVFSQPVAVTSGWGFDQAPFPHKRLTRRDLTFIGSIESPAPGTFYPFGWHVQAWQPPHPAPERRFAAPFSNIEAVFVPPAVQSFTGWGFDPQAWQPPFRRIRNVVPPFNIEAVFSFTPPAAPTVWESNWPQPPHPRPERAAAIAQQSPVEGLFSNFLPFGWHVPAPEPHPRPERSGAILPALALVETPLTRFIPFWQMAPAHPEPHPRRERSGAIQPPLAITESGLRVFYPTFWRVLPPEPHPRPERGAALLPAGFLPIIKFRATILNPNYIGVGAPRVMVSLGQPRQFVSLGLPRNRVVLGISNQVSQTNNLLPPIDATVEVETVTFDYGLILAAGVTVTSIASLTCEVVTGTDPTPVARLVGGASIGTSPNSGGANQATFQLVGTMLGGVTYRLQCVANCSDGQIISLWNHITCNTPN